MINTQVGPIRHLPDRNLWLTTAGHYSGHSVYGPYEYKTHGVYEVDFQLALAADQPAEDSICAILDVAADGGSTVLAERAIHTAQLTARPRTFSLLFVLRDIRQLEYRIAVTGTVDLLLDGKPVIRRISGILDEPARADLGELASHPDRFASETRAILRHLHPFSLQRCRKVRLGKNNDGGYICPDRFEGIDTAFSFGINDDISWDLDVADRSVHILQFDHTVADPAPRDHRMTFEAKRIDVVSGPETRSLSDLIRAHDKGATGPNLILKMDIEGGEWPVFDATPQEELARLAWIVCELHHFQGLAERDFRERIARSLEKLRRNFFVAHVHSNVWGGYSSLANVIVPNVIEVLLVNESLFAKSEGEELFPTDLDQSCDASQPDFYLGGFRY